MAKMGTDVKLGSLKCIKFDELDLAMSPAKALVQVGTYVPFADAMVKNLLRITAKDIYMHEKNISFFAKRCRDGSNTLIWFINRVEIEKPASPASVTRLGQSIATTVSSGVSPKDETPGKVVHVKLAELSEFEDLYYMLSTKIRELYTELKLRLENSFIEPDAVLHYAGKGAPTPQLESSYDENYKSMAPNVLKPEDVLHHHGEDFSSFSPFTAEQMMSLLARKWDLLMDPRLIYPLDMAIKRKHIDKIIARPLVPDYNPDKHGPEDERILRQNLLQRSQASNIAMTEVQGLKDINRMAPCTIVVEVWERRKAELEYERKKEQELELARNARRAEIQRRGTLDQLTGEPAAKHSRSEEAERDGSEGGYFPEVPRQVYLEHPCVCDNECPCQDLCDTDPFENCLCQTNPLFRQVVGQQAAEREVRSSFQDSSEVPGQDYLFGAPTNAFAQLQVAAFALQKDESMISATTVVREKISIMTDDFLERKTSTSEMSPPSTPTRVAKDPFPLEFYGSPPTSSPSRGAFRYEHTASNSCEGLDLTATQDSGIGLGITGPISPPSSRKPSLNYPTLGHQRSPPFATIVEDEGVPELPVLPSQISALSLDSVVEVEQLLKPNTVHEEDPPVLAHAHSMFDFTAGSKAYKDSSKYPPHPAVRPLSSGLLVPAGGSLLPSKRKEVKRRTEAPASVDNMGTPPERILGSESCTPARNAPPAGRRYVSAGGTARLHERPEVEPEPEFIPSYETGHLTLKQLKSLPVVAPPGTEHRRPISGGSTSDEGYKEKNADARKRIPSAEKVKKGLKKLLKISREED